MFEEILEDLGLGRTWDGFHEPSHGDFHGEMFSCFAIVMGM
jgi:hypothetical protein